MTRTSLTSSSSLMSGWSETSMANPRQLGPERRASAHERVEPDQHDVVLAEDRSRSTPQVEVVR